MPEKKKESDINTAHLLANNEKERIKRDMYRSDIEKLRLFTRMLRQNALFKKAKIIHK
jgi:hypothetical protein